MSQLPESYTTRFARRLRESFEGEASDLTIICGEREWKVHKLVLCLNSDVFKKMLQGDFKVSDNHLWIFAVTAALKAALRPHSKSVLVSETATKSRHITDNAATGEHPTQDRARQGRSGGLGHAATPHVRVRLPRDSTSGL